MVFCRVPLANTTLYPLLTTIAFSHASSDCQHVDNASKLNTGTLQLLSSLGVELSNSVREKWRIIRNNLFKRIPTI